MLALLYFVWLYTLFQVRINTRNSLTITLDRAKKLSVK